MGKWNGGGGGGGGRIGNRRSRMTALTKTVVEIVEGRMLVNRVVSDAEIAKVYEDLVEAFEGYFGGKERRERWERLMFLLARCKK